MNIQLRTVKKVRVGGREVSNHYEELITFPLQIPIPRALILVVFRYFIKSIYHHHHYFREGIKIWGVLWRRSQTTCHSVFKPTFYWLQAAVSSFNFGVLFAGSHWDFPGLLLSLLSCMFYCSFICTLPSSRGVSHPIIRWLHCHFLQRAFSESLYLTKVIAGTSLSGPSG